MPPDPPVKTGLSDFEINDPKIIQRTNSRLKEIYEQKDNIKKLEILRKSYTINPILRIKIHE